MSYTEVYLGSLDRAQAETWFTPDTIKSKSKTSASLTDLLRSAKFFPLKMGHQETCQHK